MGRPSRVSNVLVRGPLAPFADAYRQALEDRRYTPLTVVNLQRQVSHLSSWLDDRRIEVGQIDEATFDVFFADERSWGRGPSGFSRPGLACLLGLLRDRGVVSGPTQRGSSPAEELMDAFGRYLRSERGLVSGTVANYVDAARRFVAGRGANEMTTVTSAEVTGAVVARSAVVSVSATQNYVAGLRAFLRFCFIEGLVGDDISQAALAVTGRRRSLLPRGITKRDADALLASCDRRTALGRRDYALIVIMLRLGLRRSEIAALTLEDVDWRAGELVVVGKGARLDRLPLPTDVGAAIAAYLKHARPVSDRRQVFLQARAPFEPIASGTVASTVRRACRRAGVAEVGSHRPRHTVACDLVAAQVPLPQIAQVLRHQSLQSTAIYARVDLDRLRCLAQPWPLTTGFGSR